MPTAGGAALSEAKAGQRGLIVHVSDRDEKVLRDLSSAGLLPGAALEVVAAGARHVDVRIEGRPRRVSAVLAGAVYVAFDPAEMS